MGKKFFVAFAVFAGLLASLFGGNSAHATAGNTATISDGEWNICVSATSYAGSSFVADVSGTGFNAQLVFDDFEAETCKAVQLATGGNNTVTMSLPMGVNGMGYTIDTVNNKLTFAFESRTNRYINVHGSVDFIVGASKVGISFSANGGEGSMAGLDNIDLNTSFVLTSNGFTRSGYKFKNWNTKADGTGTTYEDGAEISFATGGAITLFAQWEERYAQFDTGENINIKLKKLAGATGIVKVTTVDNSINSIRIAEALPESFDVDNSANIISASNSPIKIYAWYDTADRNEDGVGDNVIYIYSDENIMRGNANMSYMFSKMKAITSLELLDVIDTSYVTNMRAMFRDMSSLTSLILPDSFDTSNVTDMGEMFKDKDMSSLTSLILPDSFDTSNVTDMGEMFYGLKYIESLTFPENFNTSKVTDMYEMFKKMYSLDALVLPDSFDTSNVTYMKGMFMDVGALTLSLPSSFNTSNVTDMSEMFCGMSSLTSLELPNSFNTSNVTDMSEMFDGVDMVETLSLPDSFNTSNVIDMGGMFDGMASLTSLILPDSFDTSKVIYMDEMFRDTVSLTSLTLPNSFNTSSATGMGYMFYNMFRLATLTLPDVFVIDVDRVFTDYIFEEISSDAALCASDSAVRSLWPGISCGLAVARLDTGSIVNMRLKRLAGTTNVRFDDDDDYNIRSIKMADALPENFDTNNGANIISASNSLYKIYAWFDATDKDGDGVDDNVINIYSEADTIKTGADISRLFNSMRAVTAIELPSNLDTSDATDMYRMFWRVESLNSLTLPEGFDTSNVEDMGMMFDAMSSLTSLTLPDSFRIPNTASVGSIFYGVSSSATLCATDATVRSLWPGVLGN